MVMQIGSEAFLGPLGQSKCGAVACYRFWSFCILAARRASGHYLGGRVAK